MFIFKKVLIIKARTLWLFGVLAGFLLIFQIFGFQAEGQETTTKMKEALREEAKKIEAQIKEYEKIIASKESEAKTLSNEIKILDAEIRKVELEIKETELALKEIESILNEKKEEIFKIEDFLSQQKLILKELLKILSKFDAFSPLEIFLAGNEISDFLNEVQLLEFLHNNLQTTLQTLKDTKKDLELEKEIFEQERAEQIALKRLQSLQEKDLREKIEGRKRLLKITRGEEKQYQNLMREAKKNIAEIKKQLFILEGAPITFEEALNFAKFASEKTGVRPALLLGLLSIESRLGINVGRGFWKTDMHPRDRDAFQEICKKLDLDPDLMPVSKKPSYGWGGAIGPGQFLPSTWLTLENEISQITGHNPPNPWNLKDAFVATALKLAKAGANLGTYSAERKAILIFFAGSRWNRPYYGWYGDKVMREAEIFQQQIDILEGKLKENK